MGRPGIGGRGVLANTFHAAAEPVRALGGVPGGKIAHGYNVA